MRVRWLCVSFAVSMMFFSLAEIAGMQAAGAAPACGAHCYVDGTLGNDSNSGLAGAPLKTIHAGVSAASAGGIVTVAAGTYVENVSIPQSLEITGAGASTIVEPAVSNPDCGG